MFKTMGQLAFAIGFSDMLVAEGSARLTHPPHALFYMEVFNFPVKIVPQPHSLREAPC